MAAFEVNFCTRKEFKKKKESGEIAFALISLFYVQIQAGQLPQEHLSCEIC